MTQWEQMKKEYREVSVPANGPHQMTDAMERARKARRKKQTMRLAAYGTMAAAAVLAIVLLPGRVSLRSYVFKAENESACEDSAVRVAGQYSAGVNVEKTENEVFSVTDGVRPEEGLPEEAASEVLWLCRREEISAEILKQMKSRMQEQGETYYVKGEEYPEGFVLLEETQPYYYTSEGILVIVFDAGSVAPKEQGIIEFTIPEEIFSLAR